MLTDVRVYQSNIILNLYVLHLSNAPKKACGHFYATDNYQYHYLLTNSFDTVVAAAVCCGIKVQTPSSAHYILTVSGFAEVFQLKA